tara:strand:- start:976 stop:1494 length:519 start_codon:yes stop_codon:yes gene_type:complete
MGFGRKVRFLPRLLFSQSSLYFFKDVFKFPSFLVDKIAPILTTQDFFYKFSKQSHLLSLEQGVNHNIMNNLKRVIVDYKKLTSEVLKLLVEKYPDGYGDDDVINFKNLKGESIEAVEVSTEDTKYLVKISSKLERTMADFDEDDEDDFDSEDFEKTPEDDEDFSEPEEEDED